MATTSKMTKTTTRATRKAATRKTREPHPLEVAINAAYDALNGMQGLCAFARNADRCWGHERTSMVLKKTGILDCICRGRSLLSDLYYRKQEIIKYKRGKSVHQLVQLFIYKVQELSEQLDAIYNRIVDSRILVSPLADHEIIKGSADGKRVGLRQLLNRATEAQVVVAATINNLQDWAEIPDAAYNNWYYEHI